MSMGKVCALIFSKAFSAFSFLYFTLQQHLKSIVEGTLAQIVSLNLICSEGTECKRTIRPRQMFFKCLGMASVQGHTMNKLHGQGRTPLFAYYFFFSVLYTCTCIHSQKHP